MKKGKLLVALMTILIALFMSSCACSNTQNQETHENVLMEPVTTTQEFTEEHEEPKNEMPSETTADSTEETTEAMTSAPVEETTKEVISETEAIIETTSGLDESVFELCVEEIVIPVPETINNIPMIEMGEASDTELYLLYKPADQNVLNTYLKECSLCGLLGYLIRQDDTMTQYAILKPGEDYAGVVTLPGSFIDGVCVNI